MTSQAARVTERELIALGALDDVVQDEDGAVVG